jgi:hypothetical protein
MVTDSRKKSLQRYNQINWKKKMIWTSRSDDKFYNRLYFEEDYVTEEFIQFLMIFQNGSCIYCNNNMTYGLGVNRVTDPFAVSIQRIFNNIAHIKVNCVLACMLCNQKSKEMPYEIMIEHGPNIRENIFLYCPSEHHIGDRVVYCDDWGNNREYCLQCNRIHSVIKTRRYRTKKKQKTINA